MKALLYVNKAKDKDREWTNTFTALLKREKIEYLEINDDDLKSEIKADVLFVFGGDGTILCLTEFVLKNNIPIIGFNAGRLGFLSEFEKKDIENAVKLFKENKLKKDSRFTQKITYKDNVYFALNDAVLQRLFTEDSNSGTIRLSISLDNNNVDVIDGDGIIISTSTGSTAYSISAGGAVLAPGINAFSLTTLAAHSLSNRPIVYSADSKCAVSVLRGNNVGLFIDGLFVTSIDNESGVVVKKNSKQVVFLRRNNYNFYNRLYKKLKMKI